MLDPTEFGKSMAAIVHGATAPLLKRIEELEARQLIKGDPGRDGVDGRDGIDGKSVTVDDIDPIIQDRISKAIEALPRPKDGADGKDGASVTVADVAPLVVDEVSKAVSQIPAPVDGKDGRDGLDGKSVTPDELRPLVSDLVAKAISEIPTPKDGVDGKDGKNGVDGKDAEPVDVDLIVDQVVAKLLGSQKLQDLLDLVAAKSVGDYFTEHPIIHGRDGNPGPKGERGEKGDPGEQGKDGVGLAGAVIDRNGELAVTLTNGDIKPLGPVVGKDGAPGKDGADFSDVDIEYDGERTITIKGNGGEIKKTVPIPLDRGYWREGMAVEKGDILTHDGNAWLAMQDNKSKPCHENKDDWRLFARKGRDGRDGKDGKPPPGPVTLGG